MIISGKFDLCGQRLPDADLLLLMPGDDLPSAVLVVRHRPRHLQEFFLSPMQCPRNFYVMSMTLCTVPCQKMSKNFFSLMSCSKSFKILRLRFHVLKEHSNTEHFATQHPNTANFQTQLFTLQTQLFLEFSVQKWHF